MEKMKKIKEALAKLVKEMYSNYPSDKGLLVIEGDELEVGATVEIEDEDGNRTVAEDGDYILEDKTKITVEGGKITEIIEPEPEVVEPEAETKEAPAEEEVAAEDTPEDVENPTNDGEESEPEAIVKLREEVNELYRIIDELKARIETLEKKPTAAPATEEFEKVKKIDTTDKKMKNLQKFFE